MNYLTQFIHYVESLTVWHVLAMLATSTILITILYYLLLSKQHINHLNNDGDDEWI